MPFNAICPGCSSSNSCNCNDGCNKTSTSYIKYVGPNLINIDVLNCDDLSTILQKIDNVISQFQISTTTTTTTTSI
jgi:hypothetical protein